MLRRTFVALAAAALLPLAVPAAAQDATPRVRTNAPRLNTPAPALTGLAAVPAEAGVVIVLRHPDDTMTHLSDFLAAAAPPFAGFAQQIDAFLGQGISNPSLQGVSMEEDWYVAMMPREDDKPATVFYIPAANATAMKKALGPGFTSEEVGTYVAYGTDSASVKKFAAAAGGYGMDKVVPAAGQQLAADADLAVIVNFAVLRDNYRDELNEFVAKAEERLDAMERGEPGPNGQVVPPAQVELFRKLGGLGLKALEDTDVNVAALNASAEMLSFKKLAHLKDGSETAKFFASQTPGMLNELDRLPPGFTGYAAAAGDFETLLEMNRTFAAMGLPAEKADELREATTDMEAAGITAMAGAFELGDAEGGVMRGAQFTAAERPEELREAFVESINALNGVEQNGLTPTVTVMKDRPVGGMRGDTAVVTYEATGGDPAALQGKKAIDALFGPGGMTARLIETDAGALQLMGGTDAEVAAVVSGAKVGSSGVRSTLAKTFPKKLNVLAAIDLPSVVKQGLAMTAESGQLPLPLDATMLRSVETPAGYAVLAVWQDERGVWSEGHLPADQVSGLVNLFMQVSAGMQGQRGGGF